MYRLPLLLIATLLLAASAVAAACGGSDGGELTVEEYFSQLQTLFDNARERYTALQERPLEPSPFDDNVPFDERIRVARERSQAIESVQRDFLDALGEFNPPADLRDTHEAYLDAGTDRLERQVEAAASEAFEEQIRAVSRGELRLLFESFPDLAVPTDREEEACLELRMLARLAGMNLTCGLP